MLKEENETFRVNKIYIIERVWFNAKTFVYRDFVLIKKRVQLNRH